MKKRLLLFTIIFSFLLVAFPNNVLAMNNKTFNQKRIVEKQKFKVVRPTKAQISAVGSELEYYKQSVIEEFDDMYLATNSGKYTTEIKGIINEYYESVTREINDYDSINQIVGTVVDFFGMGVPVYTNELFEKLYTFDTLTKFDISMVNSETDFNELKDTMMTTVNTGFDCYINKKSLYNDYYISIVQGEKTHNQNIIEDATDYLTFAEALGIVRMNVSNYEELETFTEYLDQYLYCYEDYEDDDEDSDNYLEEELGFNVAPAIYIGKNLYTNDDIKTIKKGLKIYLDNYIYRQLDLANYPVDDNITNLHESAVKNINSSYNVDEIMSIYEKTIEKLENLTGVEYRDYNVAQYRRLVKKLEELRTKYSDPKVYSETGIFVNENTIDSVIDLIDPSNIYKTVEIPNDLIQKVTLILDETLTYKEELKELKSDCIEELKDFKNNKKYNQSKVVPIVNEAIKKINAAKTIDDVYELFDLYYEKAEATIYKFKITTLKTGKGTISKSATIKYGNSYTVRIKPKVGYKISAIYVDGKKVKLTEKYTFKNVTKKHTIKVIFK